MSDTEKGAVRVETPHSEEPDLDEIGEVNGYIVDVSLITDKSLVERLKLAPDGKTILIPQPSDDPHDPLNWSWFNYNSRCKCRMIRHNKCLS